MINIHALETTSYQLVMYIYNKFIDLFFNVLHIPDNNNVTLGYIVVVIMIFSLLIFNILNIPNGISVHENKRLISFKNREGDK